MTNTVSKKTGHTPTILHRAKAIFDRTKRKYPSQQMVPASVRKQMDALYTTVKLRDSQIKQKNNLLKKSQHELSKAREKYDELFSLAPIGYFNVSRKGIILNCNVKATTILRWTARR